MSNSSLMNIQGEHKEDFMTGTAAALAGGVTMILGMPKLPVGKPIMLIFILVLVMGESLNQSGEARSRSNIQLPGVQKDLIKEIKRKAYFLDEVD